MNLRELLTTLDDPRRDSLVAIYDDYKDLFHYAKGSSHNHQAWEGGYADHIAECLRINRMVYPVLNRFRPLPFTMAQADIVLFFHDIEKPFRYGPKEHPEVQKRHQQCEDWIEESYDDVTFQALRPWMAWEMLKEGILKEWSEKYVLSLSPEEENALEYTHGEGSHHRKDRRVAGPLAAHVHHCDNTSARIWYNEGKGLG